MAAIALNVGQTTSLGISYTLAGNPVTVTGAVVTAAVDQADVTAVVSADGSSVAIAAVSVGSATVTVTSTLTDGTVLTASQTYTVAAVEQADTLVLTPGPIV